MSSSPAWMIALVGAALYCLFRAFLDLRERRFGWAVAGAMAAVILFSVPIPTHAIKIDLPNPQ